MKKYHEMSNIGNAKYVVNFYDGVQIHKDGSEFYGIRIFSNKQKKNKFIKLLKNDNYKVA